MDSQMKQQAITIELILTAINTAQNAANRTKKMAYVVAVGPKYITRIGGTLENDIILECCYPLSNQSYH